MYLLRFICIHIYVHTYLSKNVFRYRHMYRFTHLNICFFFIVFLFGLALFGIHWFMLLLLFFPKFDTRNREFSLLHLSVPQDGFLCSMEHGKLCFEAL